MNIAWVFSETIDLPPTVNINKLCDTIPAWGSWKTWRGYGTDNVICHDADKAKELHTQDFHTMCNFYTHQLTWPEKEVPAGIKTYAGNFMHNLNHCDDVVSIHLSATQNNVVMLLGFDFSDSTILEQINYLGLCSAAIEYYSKTQWVLVDHTAPLSSYFTKLPNLTQDTLSNVLSMIA